MVDPLPHFIIVEASPEASDATLGYAQACASTLSVHSGIVVLAAPARAGEALEAGTKQRAVIVFKFPSGGQAAAFWFDGAHQESFESLFGTPGFLHAISVAGIPEEGLPDEPLPTVANVIVPDSAGPKAYMLVQGTVSDPEPIGLYMETIVPMIMERGGVYRAWTTPDGPEVLAGDWPPQYVVLSEWPSISEPRDFWYSETYQNVAIPTRQPASDFNVLLFEAAP